MSKTWGFFLLAQDMILSHRAKLQLIINFFRVKAIFTELKRFGSRQRGRMGKCVVITTTLIV